MSLSPLTDIAAHQDEGARWDAWKREYSESSRQQTRYAQIAFAILLTGATAWLGLKIMTIPV